ncbi:AAA family ATPase [Haliangium sp.]|uniref:AAA family ATPase n=1 Tax=Haliangium sp. TaxID=2663208 RepID=UPI003D132A83
MTASLKRMTIRGFRSLRDVTLADLGPTTVLIGPNGSGKSNLLSAVQMLSMITSEALPLYVGRNGGASFLMHYGPRQTPTIELRVEFEDDGEAYAYEAELEYTLDESLVFLSETTAQRATATQRWRQFPLGAGHRNTRMTADGHRAVRRTRRLLQRLSFFHFHDTSARSELRTNARKADDRFLRSDGSNLAAYLLRLKSSSDAAEQAAFHRIQNLMGYIAPFLRELDPVEIDAGAVRLDWIDDRGDRFGAAHLSDGSLRALALFTALGQPAGQLPLFCVIDEPELGLHPAALELFCDLVRSASARCQIMLATQSPALLDHFDAREVFVTERKEHATVFRRLDQDALSGWLEEYTLANLYHMNVLGGRP